MFNNLNGNNESIVECCTNSGNSLRFFVNFYESIGHFCFNKKENIVFSCIYLHEEFEVFEEEYNIKEPNMSKNNNTKLWI